MQFFEFLISAERYRPERIQWLKGFRERRMTLCWHEGWLIERCREVILMVDTLGCSCCGKIEGFHCTSSEALWILSIQLQYNWRISLYNGRISVLYNWWNFSVQLKDFTVQVARHWEQLKDFTALWILNDSTSVILIDSAVLWMMID